MRALDAEEPLRIQAGFELVECNLQLVRDQNVPAVVVRENKPTGASEKASKGDDNDRGDEDRDGFERRRR